MAVLGKATRLKRDLHETFLRAVYINSRWSSLLTFIAIVFTVCALAKPEKCEEQRLDYVAEGSLLQCVMSAQPYLAQWIGEHPKWSIKSYHCEYPHMKERADARGSARQT